MAASVAGTHPSVMRRLIGGTVLTVVVAACTTGTAAGIAVQDAVVRMTMPGAPAAGYLVVVNDGDSDDALTGASSPAFRSIGLHESAPAGSDGAMGGMEAPPGAGGTAATSGMVGMRPVATIVVPAHGRVQLQPGGYHLMLEGPTGAISAGQSVDITLTFEHAGSVTVKATVEIL
ncbi:MAG TPA: copper chaperone PCu(A)C [Candidatus Limnocylindrales bacterium]